MDDLHYQYESGRNRLTSVEDQSVGFSKFSDDIDYSEYQYDPEGRLISDSQENIEDIKWRVDGKVKVILRGGSIPNQKNIIFDYDALGNRIAKHIFDDQFNLEKTTYYILDAQGNVMANYDKEIDYTNSAVYLKLTDRSIYGSSRVGVRSTDIDMLALHNPNYSMKSVKYEIGKRTYELSNHLGNVLSVISDKPIPSFEHEELAGMLADVRVAQDYSPFGVTLSGRSFEVDGGYRYSFQGQEHDDEIKGEGNSVNYTYRMHDPRVGRFFAVDPLSKEYPWYSPYSFSGNKVIAWGELEGLEEYYRADGSYIGCVGGNHEMRVIGSPEVENNVNYAIHREQKLLTHTNEYKYDVDFAKKNSELMFDVNKLKKMPPSDRLGNSTANSPIVKSSKVKEDKTLTDKVRDWERKNGTEAEGSSHGSDIENSGDGGKFSGWDPFDGWYKGENIEHRQEKIKPGVEVTHDPQEVFYDKNGYDSIKVNTKNTYTTNKAGDVKKKTNYQSIFYKGGTPADTSSGEY